MTHEQLERANRILLQIECIDQRIQLLSTGEKIKITDFIGHGVTLEEAVPVLKVIQDRYLRDCEDALVRKKRALEDELAGI